MSLPFDHWMMLVDDELGERLGMSHEDLDDWCWRDRWEDGDSPGEAVDEFLEDTGLIE